MRMNLYALLKERLPVAPRTWKELSLQFNPLLSIAVQLIFSMQSVFDLLV
jgi:hypothetical protein